MILLRLPLTASAALLLAVLVPGEAHAFTGCGAAGDCAQGFECQEVGGSDCVQPTPACAPGSSCPEPEPCEPTVQLGCVPASCAADSDCGAGMVCHEWSRGGGCASSDCACSSDDPACSCPEPACEEPTVESLCTPRYLLPCQAAADCGQGFTCEEQQSCACSGSSGSADPAPSGAARPLPPEGEPAPQPEPDCSCEPSGQFACVPQEVPCGGDAECPSGWSCQEQGEVSVIEPDCAGEGCGALPAPEPMPVTRLCFPDYYGDLPGAADDAGTPTSGDDNGGGSDSPQTPELAGDSDAESNESSSCQLGRGPARGGLLSALVVLGALVGLTRRRAQLRA